MFINIIIYIDSFKMWRSEADCLRGQKHLLFWLVRSSVTTWRAAVAKKNILDRKETISSSSFPRFIRTLTLKQCTVYSGPFKCPYLYLHPKTMIDNLQRVASPIHTTTQLLKVLQCWSCGSLVISPPFIRLRR